MNLNLCTWRLFNIFYTRFLALVMTEVKKLLILVMSFLTNPSFQGLRVYKTSWKTKIGRIIMSIIIIIAYPHIRIIISPWMASTTGQTRFYTHTHTHPEIVDKENSNDSDSYFLVSGDDKSATATTQRGFEHISSHPAAPEHTMEPSCYSQSNLGCPQNGVWSILKSTQTPFVSPPVTIQHYLRPLIIRERKSICGNLLLTNTWTLWNRKKFGN